MWVILLLRSVKWPDSFWRCGKTLNLPDYVPIARSAIEATQGLANFYILQGKMYQPRAQLNRIY